MPDQNLAQLLASPQFQQLPVEEKRKGMAEAVPGFSALSPEEQDKGLADVSPRIDTTHPSFVALDNPTKKRLLKQYMVGFGNLPDDEQEKAVFDINKSNSARMMSRIPESMRGSITNAEPEGFWATAWDHAKRGFGIPSLHMPDKAVGGMIPVTDQAHRLFSEDNAYNNPTTEQNGSPDAPIVSLSDLILPRGQYTNPTPGWSAARGALDTGSGFTTPSNIGIMLATDGIVNPVLKSAVKPILSNPVAKKLVGTALGHYVFKATSANRLLGSFFAYKFGKDMIKQVPEIKTNWEKIQEMPEGPDKETAIANMVHQVSQTIMSGAVVATAGYYGVTGKHFPSTLYKGDILFKGKAEAVESGKDGLINGGWTQEMADKMRASGMSEDQILRAGKMAPNDPKLQGVLKKVEELTERRKAAAAAAGQQAPASDGTVPGNLPANGGTNASEEPQAAPVDQQPSGTQGAGGSGSQGVESGQQGSEAPGGSSAAPEVPVQPGQQPNESPAPGTGQEVTPPGAAAAAPEAETPPAGQPGASEPPPAAPVPQAEAGAPPTEPEGSGAPEGAPAPKFKQPGVSPNTPFQMTATAMRSLLERAMDHYGEDKLPKKFHKLFYAADLLSMDPKDIAKKFGTSSKKKIEAFQLSAMHTWETFKINHKEEFAQFSRDAMPNAPAGSDETIPPATKQFDEAERNTGAEVKEGPPSEGFQEKIAAATDINLTPEETTSIQQSSGKDQSKAQIAYFKQALLAAQAKWREHLGKDYGKYVGKGEKSKSLDPPQNVTGIKEDGTKVLGPTYPDGLGTQQLYVKVPGDGHFLIHNRPNAIEKALKGASEGFRKPSGPPSGVRRISVNPTDADRQRYLSRMEDEYLSPYEKDVPSDQIKDNARETIINVQGYEAVNGKQKQGDIVNVDGVPHIVYGAPEGKETLRVIPLNSDEGRLVVDGYTKGVQLTKEQIDHIDDSARDIPWIRATDPVSKIEKGVAFEGIGASAKEFAQSFRPGEDGSQSETAAQLSMAREQTASGNGASAPMTSVMEPNAEPDKIDFGPDDRRTSPEAYDPFNESERGSVFDRFFNEDVLPGINSAAKDLNDQADNIRSMFAPASRGANAATMAMIVRGNLAMMAARNAKAKFALEKFRSFFNRMPIPDRFGFIHEYETGNLEGMPDPVQKAFQRIMSIKNRYWNMVQTIQGSNVFIEDHFSHFFKNPEDAKQIFANVFARRPIEGSKSFQYKRKFPTLKEAVEWGREQGVELTPLYDNPVDFELAKIYEMTKFLAGHNINKQAAQYGLRRFIHVNRETPSGFVRGNDPTDTVYAPPWVTVKEAYDKLLRNSLQDFGKSIGLRFKRSTNLGRGVPADAWGFVQRKNPNVTTRFGGETSIITHEVGHQLDFRYGLAEHNGKPGLWTSDPKIREQLQALAKLRHEGDFAEAAKENPDWTNYLLKPTELIANAFHAFIHAPEMMQEVAPDVVNAMHKLIADNPELEPIKDIKPGLILGSGETRQPTGTRNILGYYAYPEAAAKIRNNYLSPGLADKPWFRRARWIGNLMNQAQLGMSAFHFTFTAMDSAVSKFSLGVQQMSRGELGKGLGNIARGNIVTAPWEQFIKGNRVLEEFYHPGSQGDFYKQVVNQLIKAGGRVQMDQMYHNSSVQSFFDAWQSGNKIGAGFRAIPALFEAGAKPIMEMWVPRLKLGMFADLAQEEVQKLGPNPTDMQQRQALGRAWDSVDNRLGQMVYDNLFWNRVTKDVGMLAVRSLGWNLGTFRELGGGVTDFGKGVYGSVTGKGKFQITPKMAYVIGLPMVVAIHGAMLQYLMTNGKKHPEELKDYFFPQTGRQNPDGTPERVSLPSYMKDVYNYGEGFQYGPTAGVKQFGNVLVQKAHPIIGAVTAMMQNKDFYGVEILHKDDPAVKQLQQFVEYTASQFVPFSVRNMQHRAETGGNLGEQLQSFMGITPAPKSIDRTSAEQYLATAVSDQLPRGSKTQQQFQREKDRNEILNQFRTNGYGDPETVKKMTDAIESGKLQPSDARNIERRLRYSWLQVMAERVDLRTILGAYDRANASEKELLKPILARKAQLTAKHAPAEFESLHDRLEKSLADSNENGASSPSTAPGAAPSRIRSPQSPVPAPPSR